MPEGGVFLPKPSSWGEDYKAHIRPPRLSPYWLRCVAFTLINLTYKPQIVVLMPSLAMFLLLYSRLFKTFSYFLDQELSGRQSQSSKDTLPNTHLVLQTPCQSLCPAPPFLPTLAQAFHSRAASQLCSLQTTHAHLTPSVGHASEHTFFILTFFLS